MTHMQIYGQTTQFNDKENILEKSEISYIPKAQIDQQDRISSLEDW